MRTAKKDYLYEYGINSAWDAQFDAATGYGKVRTGEDILFWKDGFKWYAVQLSRVKRIYRQVEHVFGKLCCGGRSYDIQRLILLLHEGGELKLHICDDMQWQAENLFEALKGAHPEIEYGKV